MAKLKPLKPSLKEKKRYLVFELDTKDNINSSDLFSSIEKACLDFMGILHFAKAGVIILQNQYENNKGIIKVNNRYVDYAKASMMLIKDINGQKVNVRVIGVSGILKKAKDKFLRR